MITSGMVYWITRLDGICDAAKPFAIFGLFFGILALVMWIATSCFPEDDETMAAKQITGKCSLILLPIGILALLIMVFVPTTKEAVAIHLIPKIANNEQVQKLPDNAMLFMNAKLEEWIADIEKKSKK